MVAMVKDFSLDKIYQALLIILAFLMPLTVFGANLIIVIICLIWLFSGDYKSKYGQIVCSKLLLASIFFFFACYWFIAKKRYFLEITYCS